MATSGNFGAVLTTDDPNAIFLWEESNDNVIWEPVGTILQFTSGQGTNTLTVLRASVAESGTFVRCAVTASYQPDPTYTQVVTLTVEIP